MRDALRSTLGNWSACLALLAIAESACAEGWDRLPDLLGLAIAVLIGALVALVLLWWASSKIPNAAVRAVIRGSALMALLWASGRFEGPSSFSPSVAWPVAIISAWLVELNVALKRKLRERD